MGRELALKIRMEDPLLENDFDEVDCIDVLGGRVDVHGNLLAESSNQLNNPR
jgi:hypothetical protein